MEEEKEKGKKKKHTISAGKIQLVDSLGLYLGNCQPPVFRSFLFFQDARSVDPAVIDPISATEMALV